MSMPGSFRIRLVALTLAAPMLALGQALPRIKDVFDVGPAVYVRALTVEPARGALWVGTSAGVHEVDLADGKLRNTFTRKDGLANEYVFAVGLDRKGQKWFGTNAGGVSRYKDGQWKTFFPMHGLADYWVYSFAEQKNGDLWIGTWAGVNKVSAKSGKFTTYVKQLVNEWVYGITVDGANRVWFGTEGGVSRFDGKQWVSWTHRDGLGAPNTENLPFSANTGLGTRSRHDLSVAAEGASTYNPSYVFTILAARDGSVWAGTWGGGVARFDGKAWRNFTVTDGLAGNIVYSIAQESGGALWFGTDNGVSRYDGSHWVTLRVADGLLDRHVYAIAIAPDGDVWVGTRKGVVRIAP
ncbi:MAG: two-component regulator propeller domain-containing protein [Burkholderiaceae bacterium]